MYYVHNVGWAERRSMEKARFVDALCPPYHSSIHRDVIRDVNARWTERRSMAKSEFADALCPPYIKRINEIK
jgi:hypothetical protein